MDGRPLSLQVFKKIRIVVTANYTKEPRTTLTVQSKGKKLKAPEGMRRLGTAEPLVAFFTMTKNHIGWLNAKNTVELYFDDKQAFDKAMHLLLDLFRNYKDYKSVCKAVLLPKYAVLKPLMGVLNDEGTLLIYPDANGLSEEDFENPLKYTEYDSGKEAERMEQMVRESRGTYKLRTGTGKTM